MRQGSIRLGRVLGIPLSMDLGVLIIGGLLTWGLAGVVLPDGAPGLVPTVYWTVAAVGAVVFLLSLLAHELAHSVVARRNGVEVEGITLWLFGGLAQFGGDAPSPGAEFRITAAGPATSLLLAGVFAGSAVGLDALGAPPVYVTLLAWLGIINGFLGVFNLLPGAPLDGGRILAAVLWKVRGDRISGRIGAARVGRAVGLGLVGLGLAEILFLGGLGGLWTALIGWFLFNAARAEHLYYSGERALGDLPVSDAMAVSPPVARTWTTVRDAVEGPLRATHHDAIPVTDWDGRVVGVLTMDSVSQVAADDWSATQVVDVMVALDRAGVVAPGDRLASVMQRLPRATGGHLVVVDPSGAPVGLVGPEEFRRAIQLGRLGGRRRRTPPPPPPVVPRQRWEPPVTSG